MADILPQLSGAFVDRYRIERKLGEGGMATVYLAQDLRHERKVAVKVLRPELAAVIGAERFLTEIKTTAHLQHPHILPLFDSGRTGGQPDGRTDDFLYYVMPYVEGESLRDRLTREKQLPVADAVRIATEVASALDYAHRHGVIHRDIKPENILLHDGQTLVADFGIALAASKAGGTRMTETGMSLGTPHYMSPEQAMGEREITARSDVYAVGCVLYEMLIGEPPFTGPTAQAIVAKVVTEVPRPLLPQRRSVPPHIEAAVLTALEKLPADRFATAADLVRALATPASGTRAALPDTAGARDKRALRQPLLLAGVAGAALAATALLPLVRRPAGTPAGPVGRFDIVLPDSAPLDFFAPSFYGEGRRGLAISPDGTVLVYVARVGSSSQLYRRPLDRDQATAMPGTDGAADPIFSPDGAWIAYVAGGELRKVPTGGGAPVTVAPLNFHFGITWRRDDHIVASFDGLRQVSSAGGEWSLLPGAPPRFYYPKLLPADEWLLGGGGRLLLYRLRDGQLRGIGAGGVVPAESLALALAGSDPRYVRSGHVLYLVDGTVTALPFDPKGLRIRGQPVAVLSGVRQESWAGAGQWTVSDAGTLIYARGGNAGIGRLVWADSSGRVGDTLRIPPGNLYDIYASPDGRFVSASTVTSTGRLQTVIIDAARGLSRRVPGDSAIVTAWWPDASRFVVFTGDRAIAYTANGFRTADTLLGPGWRVGDVSPAGDWYVATRVGDSAGTYLVPQKGQTPLSRLSEEASWAVFSHDGQWLAYLVEGDGLYVSPVPATSQVFKIGPPDADEPEWSPRDDAIYYRTGSRWITVPVSTRNGFRAGEPRLLFSARFLQVSRKSYDVRADGRFLVLEGPPEETAVRLGVVTNFFTEVRRLAPPVGGQRH